MNTLCQTFVRLQENKHGKGIMITYLNYTCLFLGQLW